MSEKLEVLPNANWACWQCGHQEGHSLFCTSCHALQEPASDYYTPARPAATAAMSLAKNCSSVSTNCSRQLHPDLFTRKAERERQYALEASSILNDAYRTLRDPVKRANYVLKQEGLRHRRAAFQRRPSGVARRSLRVEHGARRDARRRRIRAPAARIRASELHRHARRHPTLHLQSPVRASTTPPTIMSSSAKSAPRSTAASTFRIWCRKSNVALALGSMSTFQIDFGDKPRIVGIDLGTTNSLVAFMDLTGPKIIPGSDGNKLVPSVVSIAPSWRGGGRKRRARAAPDAARAHRLFREAPDGPRSRRRRRKN